MPEELEGELADAERLGVKPMRVGDEGFDDVINSGTVKWAVTEEGELVFIPKHLQGTELKHPVLTNGAPVRAAGEAEIAGGGGNYFGMEINNQSGHYWPSQESLDIGKEAFERAGIPILLLVPGNSRLPPERATVPRCFLGGPGTAPADARGWSPGGGALGTVA
ncbi:hypothetical protein QCN29_31350 [Streptomyces sp. HNM0663]|uniref:Uncharacterized protein n=2 Tax=Streptomyces chengmaiensis TaxID=3040919 RepID=A0ABT6HWW1_9ACTN|nr:hypothetical protein [Streptomyces chengmaiensis]